MTTTIPHRTTIHDVAEAVCRHFGITLDELRSPRRSRLCRQARLVLCYVAQNEGVCVTTDGDLAQWLNRHRSTVTHARRRVRERLDEVDISLLDDIMAVQKALTGELFNDLQEQCG